MGCSDVQKLAAKLDHSVEAGNLVHLSMGQGQEKIAEGTLDKYVPVACLWPFWSDPLKFQILICDRFIKDGGWIFLDNVHLMQRWLGTFEHKLEQSWESGNQEFRCFYAAGMSILEFSIIFSPPSQSMIQIRMPRQCQSQWFKHLLRLWMNHNNHSRPTWNVLWPTSVTMYAVVDRPKQTNSRIDK